MKKYNFKNYNNKEKPKNNLNKYKKRINHMVLQLRQILILEIKEIFHN
jgi:hypothetical protein